MKRIMFLCLLIITAAAQGCVHYPVRKATGKTIKIVTYNVLGWGYDLQQRCEHIASVLYETDADIIALQETTPAMITALLKSGWVRQKYYGMFFPEAERPFIGLYIFSRFPLYQISYDPIPGVRKVRVLNVKIQIGRHTVTMANVHLEAPLESNELRARQAAQIIRYLKNEQYSIITGDFNFADGDEPETSALGKDYDDLWNILKPGTKGYTWNMQENYLARKNAYKNEPSRRLDRILYRRGAFKPVLVRQINHTWPPVLKGLYPLSDHNGLYGELIILE